MNIEQVKSSTYRITLHTYELAALVSAARWAVDGAEGELPREARQQLSQILAGYDAKMEQMSKPEAKS
ncbi:hypothetical protein [Fodinibius sp. Rm-B-1B1-1]|uniref:hypothetical protein n=1 Tax=Fodinibius alkaliphilus TaxID=3140241 RepID=UPI00315A87ED